MTPKHIVVGYDGSAESKDAVLWAAGVAKRRRRPLIVVSTYPDFAEEGADLAREQANVQIRAETYTGGVVNVLVELSKEAELVVLGHRGRGRFRALGSTAFSVAIHAKCPVAITRDNSRGIPSPDFPIVVGVDGSPASLKAASEAASLASQTGATLRVVFANTEPVDLQLNYPDVTVETRVINDRPERAIVEAAKDASLIVVGARGRGDFASLLLGSVSRDVVHHADCTVYVVR